MDDKTLLAKLLKIAQGQQRILEKLAQQPAPTEQELEAYLKRALNVAVANASDVHKIPNTFSPVLAKQPAKPAQIAGQPSLGETYVFHTNFNPPLAPEVGNKVATNFKSFLQATANTREGQALQGKLSWLID